MVSGMPMLRMPPGIRLIQSPYVVLDAIRTPSLHACPRATRPGSRRPGAPSPPIGGDGGTRPPPGDDGPGPLAPPVSAGPASAPSGASPPGVGMPGFGASACSGRRRGAARPGLRPGPGSRRRATTAAWGWASRRRARPPCPCRRGGSARRAAGRRPPPRHRARRLRSPRPRPCRARTAAPPPPPPTDDCTAGTIRRIRPGRATITTIVSTRVMISLSPPPDAMIADPAARTKAATGL